MRFRPSKEYCERAEKELAERIARGEVIETERGFLKVKDEPSTPQPEIVTPTKTKLLSLGFKVWAKNGKERIYLNTSPSEELLGLKTEHYASGNISSAEFNGEKISNSEARRIVWEIRESYYDCVKDKWVGLKKLDPTVFLKDK